MCVENTPCVSTRTFVFPVLILVAFSLLFASFSSSEAKTAIDERLQRVLDRGIEKYDARGVSAAAVFSDRRVWTGTGGISHDTVPIAPSMLFAIGSITKNVVATLTLRLAEEGLLSLDDPLSKWLPAYPHVDESISIRQLLNHTSGLYMFWDNEEIWEALKRDKTKIWTPEEVLAYIKEPYFAPGTASRYSNTNYLLMALIIEKATNSKLSTEFRKRFWEPMGIEEAYLSIEEKISDNQAHVYGDNCQYGDSVSDVTFLPRASHESITYGSAGLFMTAGALANWCHALFEGEVLQPASMEEMLQFVDTPSIPNMRAYGLGVQVFERGLSCGEEAIGHGGANIGTTAYMVHVPEHRFSVVVMVNAFPSECVDFVTKGLIEEILVEKDALGIIPYFEFFPWGFFMLSVIIAAVINAALYGWRRRTTI